jgi:hypothetical protein
MTPLVLVGLFLAVLALLVGYLVVCLLVMAVRSLVPAPTRPGPPARDVVAPPRWTALDDQQLARYLKQPPQ